jgi:hypothetical protein
MLQRHQRWATIGGALVAACVVESASAEYMARMQRFAQRDPLRTGSGSSTSRPGVGFADRLAHYHLRVRGASDPFFAVRGPGSSPRSPLFGTYDAGLSLYQYVGGDPVSVRDPSGLHPGHSCPVGQYHCGTGCCLCINSCCAGQTCCAFLLQRCCGSTSWCCGLAFKCCPDSHPPTCVTWIEPCPW